ncbi:MAG: alkaline phosphatase D family protein [Myxococcales bacterium]|nr:alkaline phosphatase D family protein [Myxococcales bacterium]
MNRRDFLRLSGTFFAAASLGGVAACSDDAKPATDAGIDAPPAGSFLFPQGVASGDPRETSVVLWTRAVPASGTAGVDLRVEVASDAGFATIVVMQSITAAAAADHTVRVVVTGLAADTIYYYRFIAGSDSINGRTRTAPAAGADVPIRMAWVSCQDYAAGQYHAYRQMVQEDMARPEADQIRFVLHLGDFIYETRGDGFQAAIDENFQPITVMNQDGTPRTVSAFPSGGGTAGTSNFAKTVEDYRHLYKTFASDADLQAARARWPFVHTWDDHEFTDDCWQSMANYTDAEGLDEPSQARRYAANQAWFEFIPSQLTGALGVAGVTQDAHDFATATVADAPFTAANADNFVPEPNNVAAVGSMTIYRSLRFGQHYELIVTDERSYRSDHAIPEETAAVAFEYFNPRYVVPAADVDVCDAGSLNPTGVVSSLGVTNPRATAPVGTMLGKSQKEWWKATMMGSTATWKVWGNQVPFMRFFIKNTTGSLVSDRVMDADAWDGYPRERRELTQFLATNNIKNVVLLTGDIHAHFAGTVSDDFTAATPTAVATEFIAAGISSNSVFSFYEGASRGGTAAAARALITVDASASGGSAFTENMNMLLVHGTNAAGTFAQTRDRAMALAASDRTINPHLKYADCNAQGFGVAKFTATQVDVVLTTMERPIDNSAGVKRTASFTVPKDNPAGMTGPELTGTRPFPL